VITIPFTWISTVEVVGLCNATPVLIDVDPKTYNMDVSQLEAAISPRTKAIIPVSLFGQVCDLEAINAIAKKHGVPVIEDGAQSFGAKYNGKMSCGCADSTIATTSFFPAKPLGCYGEGGAIFTNDDELARNMVAIRSHGGLVRHVHDFIGLNGRFDAMQAAVINVKMRYFPKCVEDRLRIGARYTELLQDAGCGVPFIAPGNESVWAQYTVRVADRAKVMESLKESGVPCGVYYPKGCHEQPCFAKHGYARGMYPVTENAGEEVLSLPMHPDLTDEQQMGIADALKKAIASTGTTWAPKELPAATPVPTFS